jgi:hypothetical protein
LDKIALDSDYLYAKRSFYHWFVGCGVSEGFYSCAREELEIMKRKYDEI